mmetsp:Transcript_7704/g.14041  ORF Transcript_7704/g.14041 Transcript_7704/m.14041 type:complete len:269 (-) Transcript_7704:247-1053(-)
MAMFFDAAAQSVAFDAIQEPYFADQLPSLQLADVDQAMPSIMAGCEQPLHCPTYHSKASEPAHVDLPSFGGPKGTKYRPGELFRRSVALDPCGETLTYGPSSWASAAHEAPEFVPSSQIAAAAVAEQETTSECSTTDTLQETAMTFPGGACLPEIAGLDCTAGPAASSWHGYDTNAAGVWAQYGNMPQWLEEQPAHQPQQTAQPSAMPFPSLGSRGHNAGRCKPCAFWHKEEGCQSGASCEFCHLCAPGEKQRRKRVKRAMCRNMGLR